MSRKRFGVGMTAGLLLLQLVVLSAVRVLANPTATLLPTFTLMPTETLNPEAFSLVSATTFKAPDDSVEILLPKLWKVITQPKPGHYAFFYGEYRSPNVILLVQITTPWDLILSSPSPNNSKETLQIIHNGYDIRMKSHELPTNAMITTIGSAKIGKLTGIGFTVTEPDEVKRLGGVSDFRIADFPDGRILFVSFSCGNSVWVTAKPVLDKMLDSLVVHSDVIPTATPTPISLELTATSLQSQLSTVQAKIQALTATPSPLPTQ